MLGYTVVKGGTKWEYFAYFINDIYDKLLETYNGENIYLIFDGARIHIADMLKRLYLDKVNYI